MPIIKTTIQPIDRKIDLRTVFLIVFGVIIAALMIILFLRPKPSPYNAETKKLITLTDSVLSVLNTVSQYHQQEADHYKEIAEQHINAVTTKTFYIESKKKYDKISTDTRALSNDSLIRAIEAKYGQK